MKKISFGVALFLGFSLAAYADENTEKTAAKILQVGVGARTVGMGEAGTASSDDIYSLYWNPAGLAKIKMPQLSYQHNLWLIDMNDAYFNYVQPLPAGVLGLGVNYVNYGDIQRVGISGDSPLELDGKFSPYTLAVTAGYGYHLGGSKNPTFDIGANFKFISESIDEFSAATGAIDVGTQINEWLPGLTLGLMIQNAGLGLAGYRLPLNLRLGTAYAMPLVLHQGKDRFILALDAVLPMPLDQPSYINLGTEYWYLGTVAGRLGYRISELNSLGGGAGLCIGLGAKYELFSVDYALAPFGDLGTTHRISLTLSLAQENADEKNIRRAVISKPGLINQELGLVVVPKLEVGGMRQPIEVKVETEKDPAQKSKLKKAVFEFKFNFNKTIFSWGLNILDAKGNVVRNYSGQGAPGKQVWDGRDAKNNPVAESIDSSYSLEIFMKDGEMKGIKGRIVDRKQELAEPKPSRETLAPLLFEEGSSELTPKAMVDLKNIADKLKDQPYAQVTIEGHADSNQENSQALLLSQKRADEAARYLAANFKVPLVKIEIIARGSKQPATQNTTAEGQAQNRRVLISVVYRQ